MSSKKLNPFKHFQSDQIQGSSRKIFTAHYACSNAALNLTPVTGTTIIESWGVRSLTVIEVATGDFKGFNTFNTCTVVETKVIFKIVIIRSLQLLI